MSGARQPSSVAPVPLSAEPQDSEANFDYCMVFSCPNGQDFSDLNQCYVKMLQDLGLTVKIIYNSSHSLAFALIRCPTNVLRSFAERIEFDFLLDDVVLQKLYDGREIPHKPQETKLKPYEHIYGKYCNAVHIKEEIYWRPTGLSDPFRDLVRLKLTLMLIESKPLDGGQNMKIQKYLREEKILGFFPLNSLEMKRNLLKVWFHECHSPWNYSKLLNEIKVL